MNECLVCRKLFSTASNLRKHFKKYHPNENDQLNELYSKNIKQFKFTCHCGKHFNHNKNFKKHQEVVHDYKIVEKLTKKKCPLCEYCDFNKFKLVNHFKDYHGINVKCKELEFSTLEQFTTWKRNIEFEANSRYIRNSKGSSISMNPSESYHVIYYCCHRSGTYTPQGKGIRQLKSKGSNKINAYCPASIKLKKFDSGMCKVLLIETHIGHDTEIERLSLTSSERNHLAIKITAGIPFEKIIDEVRQSASTLMDFKRIHLITKKDLYNIQICCNKQALALQNVDANNGDQISLQFLNGNNVEEYENINGILQENKKTPALEKAKEIMLVKFSNYLNKLNSMEELEKLKVEMNGWINSSL